MTEQQMIVELIIGGFFLFIIGSIVWVVLTQTPIQKEWSPNGYRKRMLKELMEAENRANKCRRELQSMEEPEEAS